MKNLTVLIFALLIGCQNVEFKTTFSTTPNKPQINQEITIKYLPEKTELAESKKIDAVIYQYNTDLISATQVEMQKKDKGWLVKFFPTKETKGAIIIFTDGEKTDDNKSKGYEILLYTKNGKPLPEALAGKVVALAQWGRWFIDLDSDNEISRKQFEELFTKYPTIKDKYLEFYLYVLSRIGTEEAMAKLAEEVESLKSKEKITEDNLVVISKYSQLLGTDAKKYEKLLQTKYPKNEYVAEIAFSEIQQNTDRPQKLVKDFLKYVTEYPNAKNLDYYSYKILKSLFDTEQTEAAIKAVKKLKDITHPYIFIYSANALENKNNFDAALKIITIGKKVVTTDKLKKPYYLTKKQWEKEKDNYYAQLLKTEAIIKNKSGNITEALNAIQKTINILGNDDVEANELYSGLLITSDKYAKAKEVIENCLKQNKATNKMTELLKTAYTKINGSDKGFDQYFAKYTSAAETTLLKKLKTEMLNYPAPNFELKNLDGKIVKFSDYKGKTVVVDFWATWCGPCKHSFPAMQKANNKFANDDNVQFLFINAWEDVDNKFQNAKDFITANNYKLNVLIDEKDEVINKFKVTGIPTKFVIGPDQNIKFKSVGFSGTNDELIKELSAMIKLASDK